MVVDRRGSAVIKAIKDFFVTSMLPAADEETSTSDDDIRLAACALLLELAYADDQACAPHAHCTLHARKECSEASMVVA